VRRKRASICIKEKGEQKGNSARLSIKGSVSICKDAMMVHVCLGIKIGGIGHMRGLWSPEGFTQRSYDYTHLRHIKRDKLPAGGRREAKRR